MRLENIVCIYMFHNPFIYSRIGNFDTIPDFGGGGFWRDQNTDKSYNLEFKTSCEHKGNGRSIRGSRFGTNRPAPASKRKPEEDKEKNEKDEEDIEDGNEGKDAETLVKPGALKDNIILIISSGSVCGLVTLIAIFGFLFVRRKKAKRQREFMENNPIYGDDYYYSPIKDNNEKVEYYEVTKNNVEKQDT